MKQNHVNLIVLLIASIYCSLAFAGDVRKVGGDKFLQFHSYESLNICTLEGTSCVSAESALKDAYPEFRNLSIDNFVIAGDDRIARVKYGLRYVDGKDVYAIFIVQVNPYNIKTGIESCHACAPELGLIVYQYHNRWKLFGLNKRVGNFGSFGSFNLTKSDVRVVRVSVENFLVTLESTYMAQGYGGVVTNIFKISGVDSYNHKSGGNIEFIGSLETGESSCGALGQRGEVWRGLLSYDFKPVFRIKMTQTVRSCSGGEVTTKETQEYVYDYKNKDFIKK